MKRMRGFTLIELLVVIAIISILMLLIIPQVGSALAKAREIACRGNLKTIATACLTYPGDHDGLGPSDGHPGSRDAANKETWCFMGKEVLPKGVTTSSVWPLNTNGTILEYIGGERVAKKLYRCPGLPPAPLYSGLGSNGYFDYAMLQCFTGTKLFQFPSHARVNLGQGDEDVLCPWIVEEDYFYYCNVNNVEPQHGNNDRLGTWHRGRGNYIGTDGSVQVLLSKKMIGARQVFPVANEWYAIAPSGKEVSIGANGKPYGWWKTQ